MILSDRSQQLPPSSSMKRLHANFKAKFDQKCTEIVIKISIFFHGGVYNADQGSQTKRERLTIMK